MKTAPSPLDRLAPSPEALKQLENLHATMLAREAKVRNDDPVEFVLVTPVPRSTWPPPPVVE